ncbi:MAG TPA: nucleotide disphospho-sugar-binding domain-containing protein [Catenuloplanes sp.]|jgi:UDP:flavonoid glycosyltransferase YjiC (YdhE family)
MRVLISSGPAEPLYFPVVPFAWALRAAGHDVLVATPESFAPVVNGSGLPVAAVCGPLEMVEVMAHDRAGQRITMPTNDAEAVVAIGKGFGRLAARTLDGVSAVIEQYRPDVVIAESHSYAGAAAAAAHGIPWVKHGLGPGDDYLAEVDGWAARELAAELEQLGLPGLPSSDLVLDTCPPVLRREGAESTQPMRFVPYSQAGVLPHWLYEKPVRPRLLLTAGTVEPVIGRGVELFRELLNALPSLGVEIVVAATDEVVSELGPLPDAVIAAGWTPLTAVLPAIDIAVHHGGPGTTMACAYHGVPQLIIPGIAKPHESVRRLTSFGSAQRLLADEVSAASVLEACGKLLAEDSYRERAAALREQITAMPSPGAVVALVEQLADRR